MSYAIVIGSVGSTDPVEDRLMNGVDPGDITIDEIAERFWRHGFKPRLIEVEGEA